MSVADIYDSVYVPDIFALVYMDLNVSGDFSGVFQCVALNQSIYVS